MATIQIMMIRPDGSIEESHCFTKGIDQVTAAQAFAWIGGKIKSGEQMQIGEAVLIARTAEGWRVHGPIDYKNLIDRLERASREEAGDGK